jgi:hypothetical protein
VSVRLIHRLLAAPLVVLLGAAMTMAAWPDGDVTSRDRELVARLTRGGAQRLEADGGHWTADAIDLADTATAAMAPGGIPDALAGAPVHSVPPPSRFTMLAIPAARQQAGRAAAPPARDRAPPQS